MKPFKVVCIKCGDWKYGAGILKGKIAKGPKIGEVCTVYKVNTYPHGVYYKIIGYSEDENGLAVDYNSKYFRRLDEYLDVTSEILKDFQPDKVEQEVFNPIPQTAN